MKRTIIVIAFIIVCLKSIYSQITTNELPISVQRELGVLTKDKAVGTIDLPIPDIKKVLYEDSLSRAKNPNCLHRTGVPIPVEIDITKDGVWSTLDDGGKLWQMEIHAEKALALDFVFSEFWLPNEGKIFLFNSSTNETIGAITSKHLLGDKKDPHRFSTGIIKGDRIILEYFQPADEAEFPLVKLEKAYYTYTQIPLFYNSRSEDCEVDINCEDGADWQFEKNAVAKVYAKFAHGTGWCSGSLVNSIQSGCPPLFLTADHCLKGDFSPYPVEKKDAIDDDDLSDWIFYWGYERTSCSSTTNPVPNRMTTGAIVKSNNSYSDFALLQLQQDPINIFAYIPYYLGWDASGYSGTGGVCIHHPNGDVKKISTYSCTPQTYIVNSSDSVYWGVQWIQGITENGSSGAPLLNNYHKVIGQLRTGTSSCSDMTGVDTFGKFSISWTGNGNSDYRRRLDYWLNPSNYNINSIGGKGLIYITGPSLVCDSVVYSIGNLPADYNVVWSKQNISATMYLTQNSPSTNQCTVKRIPGVPCKINLKASIYYNGVLCFQLTKELYSLASSFGTFSQQSCTYYNVLHPAITSKPVKTDEANFVHQGCLVTVNSMYIRKGVTITHTGVTPVDWYVNYDSNYLVFSLPLLSGGIPFNILITGEQSCGDANILFFSATGNGNLSQNLLVVEPYENHYVLNIEHNQIPSESIELESYTRDLKWQLEVYSGQTGRKMVDHQVNGSCFSLDTSNWESGLYVIRVVVDDEVLTQKITVK